MRYVLSFSFSFRTRCRTWPTEEGDVIDGYISRLSSHRGLYNHLVDSLLGHVDLHPLPLIPLITRFLPHLQERRCADSNITMRMWGDFCNTAAHAKTVQLAFNMQCADCILQAAFHNFVESIIEERKNCGNHEIFLNQPKRLFLTLGVDFCRLGLDICSLSYLSAC